ncbi:hypothetical protein RDI58_011407 [Solanum bulbocastanum]|uniref:Uncharacterized protein n=1 Tax=Solanum bulbocastanum TaxID=147425 RepID=A0AAN8YHM3_SOLBU
MGPCKEISHSSTSFRSD